MNSHDDAPAPVLTGTEDETTLVRATLTRRIAFARVRAFVAILAENLIVTVLPFAGVFALFAILSWFGLFLIVPDWARFILLAVFVLAAILTLARFRHFVWPSRRDSESRIERQSGLDHQAISVLSDRPAFADPVGDTLWRFHQNRMARRIGPLDAGLPSPDIGRRDPYGLRAVMIGLLWVGWFYSGAISGGSLRDAFFASGADVDKKAAERIDAWITPPAYTGRAPIYLKLADATEPDQKPIMVPQFSTLTVRLPADVERPVVTALKTKAKVDLTQEVAKAASTEAKQPAAPLTLVATLKDDVSFSAAGKTFQIALQPDLRPKIDFTKEPSTTVRGALEIAFSAEDDYSVSEAHAEIVPLEGDPNAVGLYGPPEYKLDIPANGRKAVKATSSRDLTSHPLSGQRVRLTLVVKDAAGQEGRSPSRDIILPARPFSIPLAATVAEQRQVFALDVHHIMRALELGEAATLRPEESIPNLTHFLAVESAMSRLKLARDGAGLRDAADYYWDVARGIEDGDLADAEKRLQNAQKALSDALANKASDEEIKKLMAELRDAMKQYLAELAKRNQNADQNQNSQMAAKTLRSQDLEKMLDQLENLARSGARDEAQKLLNDMQRMMNNLQTAKPGQKGDQQKGPMREQMDKLGKIIEEQQKLMEQTHRLEQALQDRQQYGDPDEGIDPGTDPFGEDGAEAPDQPQQDGQQQQQQDEDQAGKDGQKPGDKKPGDKKPGDQSGDQAGQNGEKPLDKMTAEELKKALSELKKQQDALEKGLGGLQKKLSELGMKPVPGFGEGEKRMKDAAGALARPDGQQAIDNQGKALEALRKGAGEMMQQMQAMGRNNPGQGMQGGQNQAGRDPLGRQSGDAGENGETADGTVKVPDEIDIQRAREILEEIRRKLSDGTSGTIERNYLERLLDLRKE